MDEKDLQGFIDIQRDSSKFYLVITFSIFVIGLFIIFIGYKLKSSDENLLKLGLQIGGAFVSSLGTFSLKEFLNRIEKIKTVTRLIFLKGKIIKMVEGNQDSNAASDLKRIDDTLWTFINKAVAA